MINVNGRYPGDRRAALYSDNMVTSVQNINKQTVILRVDDRSNLAFWMEISLSRADLEEVLRQMDSADE